MSSATLISAVEATVAVDPSTLGDAALADELLELIHLTDRLRAQAARLAWAAHRRGIGSADGSASTAAWLRRRVELREGEARALITEGEVTDRLGETGAAWRAGEISSGAARTIVAARVAGHEGVLTAAEPVLLKYARDHELRDLGRACTRVRQLAESDGTEPHLHDGVCISRTYGGRTIIDADLASDSAEIVVAAIHAFTDPPTEGDERSPARRRADALVAMAEAAMSTLGPDGAPTRARPSCTVVVDWTTLTGGADGVTGRLDGDFTGPLHHADVERLLCDCTVSRVVVGPAGLPIEAGRTIRTASAPQRRALAARDGGCRFPGCDRPPGWTDAHHVVHWVNGGRTDLGNLVLLCSHHHHVVHRPGWLVKFDGEELRIIGPTGVEIT